MVVTSGMASVLAAKRQREMEDRRQKQAMAQQGQNAMMMIAQMQMQKEERDYQRSIEREKLDMQKQMQQEKMAFARRQAMTQELMGMADASRKEKLDTFGIMHKIATSEAPDAKTDWMSAATQAGLPPAMGQILQNVSLASKEEREQARAESGAKVEASKALAEERRAGPKPPAEAWPYIQEAKGTPIMPGLVGGPPTMPQSEEMVNRMAGRAMLKAQREAAATESPAQKAMRERQKAGFKHQKEMAEQKVERDKAKDAQERMESDQKYVREFYEYMRDKRRSLDNAGDVGDFDTYYLHTVRKAAQATGDNALAQRLEQIIGKRIREEDQRR